MRHDRAAGVLHAVQPAPFMKKVNKSVLIWYSPQEMFALVTDVAHYADFLPWCDQARVLEQDEQGMTAEVGIAFGGMRKSFVTRNTHSVLDDGGRQVSIRLIKGPFSRLEGNWMFRPVGDGTQRACRVDRCA